MDCKVKWRLDQQELILVQSVQDRRIRRKKRRQVREAGKKKILKEKNESLHHLKDETRPPTGAEQNRAINCLMCERRDTLFFLFLLSSLRVADDQSPFSFLKSQMPNDNSLSLPSSIHCYCPLHTLLLWLSNRYNSLWYSTIRRAVRSLSLCSSHAAFDSLSSISPPHISMSRHMKFRFSFSSFKLLFITQMILYCNWVIRTTCCSFHA